mmetsp:Transcript_151200/g.483844  ORF Transcript_151200/g.483844 Transcript_151200/m.483844 type:complete len:239 (-) Transcript_151200:124-840(-)
MMAIGPIEATCQHAHALANGTAANERCVGRGARRERGCRGNGGGGTGASTEHFEAIQGLHSRLWNGSGPRCGPSCSSMGRQCRLGSNNLCGRRGGTKERCLPRAKRKERRPGQACRCCCPRRRVGRRWRGCRGASVEAAGRVLGSAEAARGTRHGPLHVQDAAVHYLWLGQAQVGGRRRVQGDVAEAAGPAVGLAHGDAIQDPTILREVIAQLLRGRVRREPTDEELHRAHHGPRNNR